MFSLRVGLVGLVIGVAAAADSCSFQPNCDCACRACWRLLHGRIFAAACTLQQHAARAPASCSHLRCQLLQRAIFSTAVLTASS